MKKEYIVLLFLTAAAFISTAAFFYPTLSTDAWWHMSSGREIIKNHGLPAADNFYCSGPVKWYGHEWLFDAASYIAYEISGERGVKTGAAAILFLTLSVVFMTGLYAASGKAGPASAAAFIAAALLVPYAEERPQLISILSFSLVVFGTVIRRPAANLRFFWMMPLLVLAWTNFHSTAPAGIYLLFVTAFFSVMEETGAARKKAAVSFAMIIGLSIAAAAASPLGLKGLYFFKEDMGIKKYISEWQGIFTGSGRVYAFFVWFLFSAGAAALVLCILRMRGAAGRKEALKDVLVFAPFFIAAVFARKAGIFCAIAAAPAIARGLAALEIKPVVKSIIIVAAAAVSITGSAYFIFTKQITVYPGDAVKYVKENAAPGSCVFTSFEWGGFAEFMLYPEHKVFMNGRLNAAPEVIGKFSNIYHAEGEYKRFIEEAGIKIFILGKSAPVLKELPANKWKTGFDSGTISVISRK